MSPAALRHKVLQSVANQPAPTRQQWSRTTAWLVGCCGTISMMELILLVGGRWGARTATNPWLEVAWALCALGVGSTVGPRGPDMLGRPEWALWLGSALTIVLPGWLALVLGRTTAGREPLNLLDPLEWALALGIPILMALLLARRHTDPIHPEAQGAAWGAVAGCLSACLVGVVFSLQRPAEIAFGQLLPCGFLVGLGSTLGLGLVDLSPRIRNQQL